MFVETADDDASEGGLESPWRLVGAVAATAAYLFAFERLGYLLATPLYIVAILLLQPGARARAFVATPVLVTLALYAAFRFGLLIPVPDGLLAPWLPWEAGAVSIWGSPAASSRAPAPHRGHGGRRHVGHHRRRDPGDQRRRRDGAALPFTFAMDATTALVMLAGVWAGANYGGSIPAILMRIPGTPASAAALLDGYELTRQGKAAKALGVSLVCGTIGGVISIVVLIVVLPLGEVVLQFGSPETFALALFALTLLAGLAEASFLKGLASGSWASC